MMKSLILLLLLLLGSSHVSSMAALEKKETYIVHMARPQMPARFQHHSHWYKSSLKSVSNSAEMLYTYQNVIHGFSVRLTPKEAQALQHHPGTLAVLPDLKYQLLTTRTPEFLGLRNTAHDMLYPELDSLSEVVIGVLDTGVWPESKSFDDSGLGPVPNNWKGTCESGTNFSSWNCNKKLIGARYFSRGYEAVLGPIDESIESKSPRDDHGHGTHTASTAAGSVVEGANLFGYAAGTARGMATRARVAVYKVCWLDGCFNSDILAAIDQAIEDNVNVLSMSLGGAMPTDYYSDIIAIGAFAAMEKGIFVSCAAGNDGPSSFTLSNMAPWITTVGAGTLDRDFPAFVSLGNGQNYSGVSLFQPNNSYATKLLPLVYGNWCKKGTLTPEKVAGKIVLCDRGVNDRVEKGAVVKAAGGLGMVLANTAAQGEDLTADAHLLPSTLVGQKYGDLIKAYLFTDPNPTATILSGGTKVGIEPSPMVAAFSSRGPNPVTPDILKPDMIAPGVNILAAWTGGMGPSGSVMDPRQVGFNIISGTSMSCPHVSGLAALIKAAHPEWSPAAIKSALMTTSYVAYKNGNKIQDTATAEPSTPFDHGSGHVDPVSALDPGLVYNITVDDYLRFLCALNYTQSQMSILTRRTYTCDARNKYSVTDFNYPSFAVNIDNTQSSVVKHTRTLTNVGSPGTYKVSIVSENLGVKISVEPAMLTFSQLNEKKSYTVTFTASSMPSDRNSFARIEWSDGNHIVGSPIAITCTGEATFKASPATKFLFETDQIFLKFLPYYLLFTLVLIILTKVYGLGPQCT